MHSKPLLLVVLFIAGTLLFTSACNLTSQPDVEPTAPPTLIPTATAQADAVIDRGIPAVGWYGLVTGLPEGSQFDDYLFLISEGAPSIGIVGRDSDIDVQITALREANTRAHFWGSVACSVLDYNGCQFTVSKLRADGPGGIFPADPVDGWQGKLYGSSAPQIDDYFVLAGDFPIQYGIHVSDDVDPDRTLAQSLMDYRDTDALLSIDGEVVCGVTDAGGCQIQVSAFDVIDPGNSQQEAVEDTGDTSPAQVASSVINWQGRIKGNAAGSTWAQYDDYFELSDGSGTRYGIASHDGALAQQIISLRDSGSIVRVNGTLWSPVPDSYNNQIVVTSLEVVQAAPVPTPTCSLTPRLTIGTSGRVAPGPLPNAMRSAPGTVTSTVLGTIPGGTVFSVLEGPVCASGYYWWRVDANGFVGWTAEGEDGDYWLDPMTCGNGLSIRLIPGEQGRVTLIPDEPNRLRQQPTSSSTLIGEVPPGGIFTVLDGPVCTSGGLAWWQINFNGIIGWTAEGNAGVYWLEPYTAVVTEPVSDLHGVVVSVPANEPHSGADDYLQGMGQNGTRYGIASTDPSIAQQLVSLRNTGREIRVWGQLRRNVPDYNNVQINVTQLVVVSPPPSTCVLPPRLVPGFSAIVTPGLPNSVRTAPGTGSGSTVQGQIPGGTIFYVLEGPQCVDNYNWWRITTGTITGWTAEGQSTEYWLQPMACGNGLPTRLVPGLPGRVTTDPPLANVVRDEPGRDGTLLGEIPPGGVFTVLEGPRCGPEGKTWWRVNYSGLIGWTAEGEPGSYWLEPQR